MSIDDQIAEVVLNALEDERPGTIAGLADRLQALRGCGAPNRLSVVRWLRWRVLRKRRSRSLS